MCETDFRQSDEFVDHLFVAIRDDKRRIVRRLFWDVKIPSACYSQIVKDWSCREAFLMEWNNDYTNSRTVHQMKNCSIKQLSTVPVTNLGFRFSLDWTILVQNRQQLLLHCKQWLIRCQNVVRQTAMKFIVWISQCNENVGSFKSDLLMAK
jgi:hypothetical protein